MFSSLEKILSYNNKNDCDECINLLPIITETTENPESKKNNIRKKNKVVDYCEEIDNMTDNKPKTTQYDDIGDEDYNPQYYYGVLSKDKQKSNVINLTKYDTDEDTESEIEEYDDPKDEDYNPDEDEDYNLSDDENYYSGPVYVSEYESDSDYDPDNPKDEDYNPNEYNEDDEDDDELYVSCVYSEKYKKKTKPEDINEYDDPKDEDYIPLDDDYESVIEPDYNPIEKYTLKKQQNNIVENKNVRFSTHNINYSVYWSNYWEKYWRTQLMNSSKY